MVVVGEHHPIHVSQPIQDASLAAKNMSSNGWNDVHNTHVSFTMPTPGTPAVPMDASTAIAMTVR